MNLQDIEKHWSLWAQTYKDDLRATTKTATIKQLEVYALLRAIQRLGIQTDAALDVLEVGCGNGYNCFGLANSLTNATFTGVDFIEEMVLHARSLQPNFPTAATEFYQGNVLALDSHPSLKPHYDIVFTDRCIINLNSFELQRDAVKQLLAKVRPNGHLLMIENMTASYGWQNELRSSAGLMPRTPDKFNLFIDEENLIASIKDEATLVDSETFAALHDLLLYVLIPMTNGGHTDYAHPLVEAATKLLLVNDDRFSRAFGAFGQNRLLVFQRKS